MKRSTKTESESIHFADLFFKGQFEVPWHQRRYDWKKEHVIALLQDIDDARESKQECYFLSSLLLMDESEQKWQVNDGQQRMMTYSLICARFARLFNSHNEKHLESLAMRILFHISEVDTYSLSDADNLAPRLKPSADDESRFNLLIRGQDVGQNGKLTVAWQEIDKFVSALSLEKAKEYFDFLVKKIEVSCLTIPSDMDPNLVFETVNFRGKPLDNFDLIRNHFYSYFNDKSESARRDTVKNALDHNLYNQFNVGNGNKSSDYMQCYLQCEYGFLRKEQLYRHTKEKIKKGIKSFITETKTPADYIYDLIARLSKAENAEIFSMIARENIGDGFIERFNNLAGRKNKKRNLKTLLDELRSYTVVYPVVFALLNRFITIGASKESAKVIYRVLQNITSFVMRTASIEDKFQPSLFESELSNLAQKIMNTKSIDALSKIDILDILKNLDSSNVMDDEKFIKAFSEVEIKDVGKSRRILYALNKEIQPSSDIIQFNQLTLEHILPKSTKHLKKWTDFDEKRHKDWVNRLGNLTLLSKNENRPSDADNESMKKKKKIFEKSILTINKNLAKSSNDNWSPKIIETRQKKMAKHAAKIWSFTNGKS